MSRRQRRVGALQFGAGQLSPMHNTFVKNVKKHGLHREVQMKASDDEWRKMTSGRVSFALWHGMGQVYEDRPVVPLVPPSGSPSTEIDWWMSWHEEWTIALRRFQFRTAGWAVYCAPPTTRLLNLAIRAEWGPLAEDGSCDSNRGQPHWHTHVRFPWTVSLHHDQHVTDGLNAAIAIEDMHLAMGGWRHPKPRCWQHPVGNDLPAALSEWAVATLEYIRGQIQYVKIETVEVPASW